MIAINKRWWRWRCVLKNIFFPLILITQFQESNLNFEKYIGNRNFFPNFGKFVSFISNTRFFPFSFLGKNRFFFVEKKNRFLVWLVKFLFFNSLHEFNQNCQRSLSIQKELFFFSFLPSLFFLETSMKICFKWISLSVFNCYTYRHSEIHTITIVMICIDWIDNLKIRKSENQKENFSIFNDVINNNKNNIFSQKKKY